MVNETVTNSMVGVPTNTIMLYESHADDLNNAGLTPVWSAFGPSAATSGQTWLGNDTMLPATCGSSCTSAFPNTINGGVSTSHQGMANFLYCDGHVKMLAPTRTVDPAGAGNLDNLNQWYADRS